MKQKTLFLLLVSWITAAQAALFGLFSNPAINQDVVWLNVDSTSISHTSTEIAAIMYDENVYPSVNLTQPNRNGLRGILYDRNQSCVPHDNTTLFFNEEYTRALPRIALIRGGGLCTFVDKLRLAQLDGAIGAIVYPDGAPNATDYVNTNEGHTMKVPLESDIGIPAFYVDMRIGTQLYHRMRVLAQRASSTQQQAVRILMLSGNSRGPNPWELTLIIMIVLLGIGFLTSVAMHCHLLRKNRILQRRVEQGLAPPPLHSLPMGKQLLDPAQLDTLFPTATFKAQSEKQMQPTSSNRSSEDTTGECCVICLESFNVGQIVRRLPCNHEYHTLCIDPWLVSKAAECPLCKYNCAPKPDESTLENHYSLASGSRSRLQNLLRKFFRPGRSSTLDVEMSTR